MNRSITTGVAAVIAIAGYANELWPGIQLWIPGLATIVILLLLNLPTVKAFGETEFWFALIKIVAIVALIAVGLVMIFTGFQSDAGAASFTNLWNHGGFFPKEFMGFVAGFQIAVFAFVGIELVGTAETKNPEHNLPRAISAIPLRVMLFYVGALIIHLADGVRPGQRRRRPQGVFGRLSSRKVPQNALFLSCVLLLAGVVLLYAGKDVGAAFDMVTTVSAVCFMFVWSIILAS